MPDVPILARLTAGKLTLLVESRGELAMASDRPGIPVLRAAVSEHPALFDGADVALPAVGLAAAYLLVHGKVGRVYTPILTHEARKALDEEGIEHTAGQTVKKLSDALQAAHEPFDGRAREAVTPLAFVEDLRWNQE
jgi:hypothetical protein